MTHDPPPGLQLPPLDQLTIAAFLVVALVAAGTAVLVLIHRHRNH